MDVDLLENAVDCFDDCKIADEQAIKVMKKVQVTCELP